MIDAAEAEKIENEIAILQAQLNAAEEAAPVKLLVEHIPAPAAKAEVHPAPAPAPHKAQTAPARWALQPLAR